MTDQHVVVGHGLLGSAVAMRLGATWRPRVRWSDPDHADEDLVAVATRMAAVAHDRWSLSWCAGTGHVGSDEASMRAQVAVYERFLGELRSLLSPDDLARGSFFFASSAGGIHAKGDGAVSTELSVPHPRSPYGASKLAQEDVTREWADDAGVRCLVGRISNLYGSRQDLHKPQGFISHLCRSILVRRPFVLSSLADTTRDFVAADDVARRVGDWIDDDSHDRPDTFAVTKLLVSGRSVTLNDVIGTVGRVARLHPAVVYGVSQTTHLQPRHSRFRSHELVRLDHEFPARPLEVGVDQTWTSMRRAFAAGRLQ